MTRKNAALWVLLMYAGAAASAATTSTATIQEPRPFGYVLGDTLTQRVLLQSHGHNFDPAELPVTERMGLWVARRSAKITSDDNGQRWLVMDYQLINAPQQLMTVNLPAVTLKQKTGTEELSIPEWPISIAPLTPRAAFGKGGLQDLRPDHPAPTLPTSALWRQLEIWSSALAITLVAWLVWWLIRYIRAATNQPFARASREVRGGDSDSLQAWLALHRAFDSTAGRALQIDTLPALFQRAPHFEPQRAEIERFYAESTRRFFSVAASPDALPRAPTTHPGASAARHPAAHASADALPGASTAYSGTAAAAGPSGRPATTAEPAARPTPRSLCATLRRIEKQHER